MKKYKLLKTNIISKTLFYRIEALMDFGDVKAGDLGGYIQSESNLSQDGDCWVYYNAVVCHNARISGSALISGKAKVFDSAEVSDKVRIFGKAKVFGPARVSGKTEVYGSARVYKNVKDIKVISG